MKQLAFDGSLTRLPQRLARVWSETHCVDQIIGTVLVAILCPKRDPKLGQLDGIGLVEELISEHVNKGGLALSAAHQRLLDDAPFLRRLELS